MPPHPTPHPYHIGDAVTVARWRGDGTLAETHEATVVGFHPRTGRVSVHSPTFKARKRRAYSPDSIAPRDEAEARFH